MTYRLEKVHVAHREEQNSGEGEEEIDQPKPFGGGFDFGMQFVFVGTGKFGGKELKSGDAQHGQNG